MHESIHRLRSRLATQQGAAAIPTLQALARTLGELGAHELGRLLEGASGDLLLAAAMASSDEVDRAKHAGDLAERAERSLPMDPVRRALVQLMRAVSAFHEGQFQDSRAACTLGLQSLGQAPAPLLRAKLLAQQAVASKHLGLRDEALSQNLAALQHAGDDPSPDGLEVRATLHNNIGVLLLAQGDQDAAIRHLRRALEEAEGAPGTDAFQVMVHLNLGRLLLRSQVVPTEAAEHLERGAALAKTVPSETMKLRAQESLALVRRRQGRLTEALDLLRPVVEHWEAVAAPEPLAAALLARGRVRRDLDEEDADADLVRAFALAEATQSFDLMLEAAQVLTDFLEARGRYREACTWHARRHELEKRQYDREKSARMEEMHARHRIEQVERDLIAAKEHAEAASRAKSGFLAITSHELRTPLNGIIGYTELLLDDTADGLVPPASDLSRDLAHIHASAIGLQRLIDRILTLTSLDEGDASLAPAHIDVRAHLTTILQALEPTVKRRENTLTVVLDASLDQAPMHTDPTHLAQIVQHLVDNAAAFTEHGQVTVTARRHHEHLHIHVQDTGTGFDAASLEQMLQPFRQTDMSYTRLHEGLGIGLTLCHHQCSLLGGTLGAVSEVGAGSTFRVALPWALPESEEGTSPATG